MTTVPNRTTESLADRPEAGRPAGSGRARGTDSARPNDMTETRDWIDVLERREREAEARQALGPSPRREVRGERPHIGEALARARRAAGLSCYQLALRVGTSPALLERLEESAAEGHSLDLLLEVAEALEVDLHLEFTPRR